jgi:hypothetical protein
MKVEIDSNNNLVIRIPVNNPLVPSGSGKTRIVASSKGNKETECVIDGKKVIVGVNAYVK